MLLVPLASTSAWAAATLTPRGLPYQSLASTWSQTSTWMYGDSITYQNWQALGRVATPTAKATPSMSVNAWWGRATAPTVTALLADLRARAHAPKVVVMAIGTNDTSHPGAMVAQVRIARAAVPKSVRLLWVNVYRDTADHGAAINKAIASVPGVQVIDWSHQNVIRLRPDGGSSLLADGTHLNFAGQIVWVNVIRHAVIYPS